MGSVDLALVPKRVNRAITGMAFRRGLALDEAVRSEIVREPASMTRRGPAEFVLTLVSAVIVLLSAAAAFAAIAVWFRTAWVPPAKLAASVGLFIIAAWFRPRFDSIPGHYVAVGEGKGPALRSLVEEIATLVGTQPPQVIAVSPYDVNMAVGRVGWRGRPALLIGLPLWVALTPPMRAAVLGHEMGHLVTHDPLRSQRTAPARHVFSRAVEWIGGHGQWAQIVGRFFLAIGYTVLSTIQLAIDAVALPDHRRAEYAADVHGAKVAGTAAAIATEERLLMMDELLVAVAYAAERLAPADWEDKIIGPVALTKRDALPVLGQLSRRSNDLWSNHPPAESRIALLRALPAYPPMLAPNPQRDEQIDLELSRMMKQLHAVVLGPREYRGEPIS